ncbi:prepilin peptidase [Streptomyces sp. NPDC058731]|uniref:prepilin peptidase n=1 Tax=Streptomyces sp. NPDC058731 TaxID=3346613 RepID=UPI0036C30D7F
MTVRPVCRSVSRVYALPTSCLLWGALTGLLVLRAAYRLSVEPAQPWRLTCQEGHVFAPGPRGWVGMTPCGTCAPAGRPGWAAAVATALCCVGLAEAVGTRPELAVWLLLTPPLVLLALVDARVHRLPDRLTLPLAAGVPVLLGLVALLPGSTGSWPRALVGGLTLGGVYAVLFLINPNGMGLGDVKLAVPLGVALGWYGWDVLFLGAFAGFVLGAVYGIGLVLLRRANRKSAIPFGPFMIAGAMAGLLLGAAAAA